MTWWDNIVKFVSDNASVINAWLTPANVLAVIGAIVAIIKNRRTVKKNTDTTTDLNASIVRINNIDKAVSESIKSDIATREHLDLVKSNQDSISQKFIDMQQEMQDKFDELEDKITAILDVQSLVYSTVQDNELRGNIQNVIAGAKFTSDKTRSALKEKIENMKAEVLAQTQAVAEVVNEKSDTIKTTIDNKKKTPRRY